MSVFLIEAAPVYIIGLDDKTVKITKAIYLTPCCLHVLTVYGCSVLKSWMLFPFWFLFCFSRIVLANCCFTYYYYYYDFLFLSFHFLPPLPLFLFCSECLSKCLRNEIPHYPSVSTSFRAFFVSTWFQRFAFTAPLFFVRRCMNFFFRWNKAARWHRFASHTNDCNHALSIAFCSVHIFDLT